MQTAANNNIYNKFAHFFQLRASSLPVRDRIILSFAFFLKICPFFSGDVSAEIDLGILIVLFLLWRSKGYKQLPRKVFVLIFIVFFMVLLQGVLYSGFSLLHLVKYPLFFVVTPYFIYRVYGVGAFRLVADFVLITSFISLPFWIAQNLSSSVDNTLVSFVHALHSQFPWDSWPRSMLIYTVGLDYSFMDEIGLYRFSSLFSEPGKFSFWINYAIIIYLLSGDKILSKRILFLIGMLITTFSTGGYLQFFMIALAYFLASSSYNIGVRYALLGIFLIFFITQYQQLSFLQPKIQEHIGTQQDVALEGSITSGRFIRARKGLEAINSYPVFGRGITTDTQVESTRSATYIGNVGGFIGFTARYGIPLSILFFVFFFRGFKYLTYITYRSTFLALGLWASVMAAFIGQGTPLWNPIMLMFFMHGYFHYGVNRNLTKPGRISSLQNYKMKFHIMPKNTN